MEVRQVRVSDADNILALMNRLDNETTFMLYEPGERTTTEVEQAQILASFIDANNKVMLVLSEQDEIAGFIVGIGQPANRNKHVLYCVIGIQHSAAGQGFGKKMMSALEAWARAHGFARMELGVMCHNARAFALYRACGFEVEGVKRNTMRVDGEYVDEYMMAKLIEEVA
ncbi:GNAT family protein [Aeromonas sp. MR7]|uniref:GNAT family N-acetyltransferase n=1 Tax=Aeromonas sp. MR7 TaxID=2923419 RepID=UPI001F4A8F25|nr:GNAT family protein [Aeromonas sp. MR7]MCH7350085.1 GNAT family N-acetyltransferase [Aeromonas sp. MR7]